MGGRSLSFGPSWLAPDTACPRRVVWPELGGHGESGDSPRCCGTMASCRDGGLGGHWTEPRKPRALEGRLREQQTSRGQNRPPKGARWRRRTCLLWLVQINRKQEKFNTLILAGASLFPSWDPGISHLFFSFGSQNSTQLYETAQEQKCSTFGGWTAVLGWEQQWRRGQEQPGGNGQGEPWAAEMALKTPQHRHWKPWAKISLQSTSGCSSPEDTKWKLWFTQLGDAMQSGRGGKEWPQGGFLFLCGSFLKSCRFLFAFSPP